MRHQHPFSGQRVIFQSGVPQTDILRYDRGRHRGQFGSPADSEQFSFLYAHSPPHRVRAGTCYPATLITTALNDDRSPAWSAMKFAAALQAAQSCQRPVLLRANLSGGHYGEPDAESVVGNSTGTFTFIASQLGMRAQSAQR
ncbi:MAG: prolyl oligopeptidase family serine peptidase [Gemmatimonadaceae bacterium]